MDLDLPVYLSENSTSSGRIRRISGEPDGGDGGSVQPPKRTELRR